MNERLGSCGLGLFYLLFESGASQSENYRPRASSHMVLYGQPKSEPIRWMQN
jgi:hypothetical protein